MENKENARPAYIIREDTDSDSGDGPVLYRDDDNEESTYGTDSWLLTPDLAQHMKVHALCSFIKAVHCMEWHDLLLKKLT